jgi:iron complex transport system substrate-binding protein
VIIDYGNVTGRYVELAKATQARTGIPTILLDGSLDRIPATLRELGAILDRRDRAAILAGFAEALLRLPPKPPNQLRVFYARGADGLNAVVPGGDLSVVFPHLGWQPVAPEGDPGPFRRTTIEAIRTLDPDILIFADPAMRATLATDAGWQALRAVREGRAMVAPALPFGWIEEPPSINRLLGLARLRGHDKVTLAAMFNAVFYGHVLTAEQRDAVLAGVKSP